MDGHNSWNSQKMISFLDLKKLRLHWSCSEDFAWFSKRSSWFALCASTLDPPIHAAKFIQTEKCNQTAASGFRTDWSLYLIQQQEDKNIGKTGRYGMGPNCWPRRQDSTFFAAGFGAGALAGAALGLQSRRVIQKGSWSTQPTCLMLFLILLEDISVVFIMFLRLKVSAKELLGDITWCYRNLKSPKTAAFPFAPVFQSIQSAQIQLQILNSQRQRDPIWHG